MNSPAREPPPPVYAKLTLIAYPGPDEPFGGLTCVSTSCLPAPPCSLPAACAGTQTLNSAPNPLGTSSVQPASTHTFAKPTDPKTYNGIGGSQIYDYLTDERDCCNQQGAVYSGNATTARNTTIQVTYDPRDAIFTLILQDPLSRAATQTRLPGS